MVQEWHKPHIERRLMSEKYDVAIVGGGVAGLAAGLYSVRLGMSSVLLEKAVVGGHIINADVIENYPGFPQGIKGYDLVTAMRTQALGFGLEVHLNEVEGLRRQQEKFLLDTPDGEYEASAVIVASGGRRNRLGVPGEAELEGRGVSYCATCDGDFFADQWVAVVGGGDAALDEALYLTKMCSKVTIAHRRDDVRASHILRERAIANPKIEFLWSTVVERVLGEEEVKGVQVRDLKTQEAAELPVAGLFVYTGTTPETAWLKGIVPTDAGGHVVANLWMETQVPGLFAAGEVRQHSARQVVTVAGDGATAAIAAHRHLRGLTT